MEFVSRALCSRLCILVSLHPMFYFKSAKDFCKCHPSDYWIKLGNDMCSFKKLRNARSHIQLSLVQLCFITSSRCQNDVINGGSESSAKFWCFLPYSLLRLQGSFRLFNQTALQAQLLNLQLAHEVFQVLFHLVIENV